MNCDPKTIVKYAEKLSVREKINTNMIIRKSNAANTTGKNFDYNNELLNFIKLNPGLNRTEIRNLMKKQYTWLYRHDKDWLMENLLACIDKNEIDNKSDTRVDWNERDKHICDAIKTEYEKIISSGKLIRITKSLGNRTGFSSLLYRNIEKLPMTSQMLERVCESVDMFQMRRIKIVAEQLYEKNGSFRRWELVRATGIKKKDEIKLGEFIDGIIGFCHC